MGQSSVDCETIIKPNVSLYVSTQVASLLFLCHINENPIQLNPIIMDILVQENSSIRKLHILLDRYIKDLHSLLCFMIQCKEFSFIYGLCSTSEKSISFRITEHILSAVQRKRRDVSADWQRLKITLEFGVFCSQLN